MEPDGVATGAGVSEEEEIRGSCAIQKGEQPWRERTGDERGEGGHSRPAPVVKRNGAKRTKRTSVPAAWEEEIERREGNGPLERALAEPEGAEGRARTKRWRRRRRGDACATKRVETKCTGIHVYIGGVRETLKEAREDRGRPEMKGEREVGTEGKSEEGRRGREKF